MKTKNTKLFMNTNMKTDGRVGTALLHFARPSLRAGRPKSPYSCLRRWAVRERVLASRRAARQLPHLRGRQHEIFAKFIQVIALIDGVSRLPRRRL